MNGNEGDTAGSLHARVTSTGEIKHELSRHNIFTTGVLRAETSALLRFAATMQVFSGRLVIQTEVDLASTARRLQWAITELYRHPSELVPLPRNRYLVRVIRGGEDLARKTGLIDDQGIPARGLPPMLARASRSETEALWRGVFLASGSLAYQSGRPLIGIRCPGPEAAMGLGWAASRIGFETTTRETRETLNVIVKDPEGIDTMLRRMGAQRAAQQLQLQRTKTVEVAFPAKPVQRHLKDLNRIQSTARTRKALQILGNDTPTRLRYVGELRIKHSHASLEELSKLAEPPINRATLAGRLQRLQNLADQQITTRKTSNKSHPRDE